MKSTGDSRPPCLHYIEVLKNTLEPLIAASVPVQNTFKMFTNMGDLIGIFKILNRVSRFIQSYAAFRLMEHKNSGLDDKLYRVPKNKNCICR